MTLNDPHKRTCKTPGCGNTPAGPYSPFCAPCSTRKRRHGSELQRGLLLADLKEQLKLVKRYRKRNRHLRWDNIHARWDVVVNAARDLMVDVETGKPHIRHQRQAAESIIHLAEAVETSKIVDHILACYLLKEFDPRRFVDEAAFRSQLVRILRKLDKGNSKAWFNEADGRPHRCYVELSPRANKHMSDLVVPALGVVGVHVAGLEREKIEGAQKAKEALRETLARMRA